MSLEDEDRLDFGEDGEDEYEDQISLGEGEGQQDHQAEFSSFDHAQIPVQRSDSAAANGVAVPVSSQGRSVRPGASEDEQGPLPQGWVVRLSRQGEVYYLHEPTKASMWDRPTETSLESPAVENDAGTQSAAVPAASMATPTVEATTSASALHHTQDAGDMQEDTPVQAAGPSRETIWGRQPQRPQSQAFTTKRDPAAPSAPAQRTAPAQSTARSAREVAAEAAAARAAAKGVKAAEPSSAMARSDDRSAIPVQASATRPLSPRNDPAIPTGPRARRPNPSGPQARMPQRSERFEDRSMDQGRNGRPSAATQVTGPSMRAERDFRERPTFADDDRWRDGPVRSANSSTSVNPARSDRHASDAGWAGRDRLDANSRGSAAPRPLQHSDIPAPRETRAPRERRDDIDRDLPMKSEKRRELRDVPRERPEERRVVSPRAPTRAYDSAQWAEPAPTVYRDYRERPTAGDSAMRDREEERQRFDDRQRSARGERTIPELRSAPPRNFGREAVMERSQQDRRLEEDRIFDRRRPADRDGMFDGQRPPHLATHVSANQRFDAVEPRDRGWGDRTGRGNDTDQNPKHPPRRRSPSPPRTGDNASTSRRLPDRSEYRVGNDRAAGAGSRFGLSTSSADRSPPVKRQWGAPARAASPPTKLRTVDQSTASSRPVNTSNDAPSDIAPAAAAAAASPVPADIQLDHIKATAVSKEPAQPSIETDTSPAPQVAPQAPIAVSATVEAPKATVPKYAPVLALPAEEAKQTNDSSEVAKAADEKAQQNKPPPLQRITRKREMSPGLASRLDRPLSPADARKQGPLSARTARAKARSPMPAEDSLPSPALSSRLESEGQPSLLSRMSSEDGGPKRNIRGGTVSRDEGRASKRSRLESRLENHNGEASSSNPSNEPVTLKQALNFAQRVAKEKAADAASVSHGISILGAGRQKEAADGPDTREGTPSSKALAEQQLLDFPANTSQANGSRSHTDAEASTSTGSIKSLTIHGLAGLPPKPSVAEGSPRGRNGDATPPAPLADSYRPAGRKQQGDRADSRGPRVGKQPVDRYIPESAGPPARRRSPPAREDDRSGPRRFRRN